MPAAIALDPEADTISDVHTDGHRGKQLCTGDATDALRGSERGRKHDRVSMHVPAFVRVVKIERMSRERVAQRRVGRRKLRAATEQRRLLCSRPSPPVDPAPDRTRVRSLRRPSRRSCPGETLW